MFCIQHATFNGFTECLNTLQIKYVGNPSMNPWIVQKFQPQTTAILVALIRA
jgi:hypothetical protein